MKTDCGRGLLAARVDVGRPVGDDQPLVASRRRPCRRTTPHSTCAALDAEERQLERRRAEPDEGRPRPRPPAARAESPPAPVGHRHHLRPDPHSSCGSWHAHRTVDKGSRRPVTCRQRNPSCRTAAESGTCTMTGKQPRPRRRLEGDHRPAAAGRPPLVRRHRQGRRPVRGRGAPARAAADRGRRDADRRGHRPAAARLRAPGDGRRPGRRAPSSRSPTRSPSSTRSTTSW